MRVFDGDRLVAVHAHVPAGVYAPTPGGSADPTTRQRAFVCVKLYQWIFCPIVGRSALGADALTRLTRHSSLVMAVLRSVARRLRVCQACSDV